MDKLVIKLIEDNKTTNEICETLNISRKRLYNILIKLKTQGKNYDKKYYYDGSIRYSQVRSLNIKENNVKTIITAPQQEIFDALLISDIHIGNNLERLDLLKRAYDYCIKENIHIIINAGDIIDGMLSGSGKKIHDSYEEQIDYAIKKYPFDKNILNFSILGNHEYGGLQKEGINFAQVLDNYRHDIIPIGYKEGIIKIKNDKIRVRHQVNGEKFVNFTDPDIPIIIHGHSHGITKIKTIYGINGMNALKIILPSLSGIQYIDGSLLMETPVKSFPCAVRLRAYFVNGLFAKTSVSQVVFEKKDFYILNENRINLLRNRAYAIKEIIENEEKIKTLQRN